MSRAILLAGVAALTICAAAHADPVAPPSYSGPPPIGNASATNEAKECVPDKEYTLEDRRANVPVCGMADDGEGAAQKNRARVTVTPPYQGPPPIGWVYSPYTQCADPPRCSMGVVSVQADGLNVRAAPNGPPTMALVNGTPLLPVTRQGPWLLVAAACDLTPTFLWSWTAGVPLNRCWIW
jgi:hypothetical protein